MKLEKIENIAVVRSEEKVIVDSQSAPDLLMTSKYELGTKNIAIDMSSIWAIRPKFFRCFPSGPALQMILL